MHVVAHAISWSGYGMQYRSTSKKEAVACDGGSTLSHLKIFIGPPSTNVATVGGISN